VTQKQIAVVGGGVAGVCTAYFLARAGHEVVVIERHHNVAQEASFCTAGITGPGYATPWAAPGMPLRILRGLFGAEAPVLVRPTLDRATWRWIRRWLSECTLERYRINRTRMQRLAAYSQSILQQLGEYHQLAFEQTRGVLQLFRTDRELKASEAAIALLAENGIAHRLLDPDAARAIEPGLAGETAFAAALHLQQDEAGNCPLFARRLRHVAAAEGVSFHFTSTVQAIEPVAGGVLLHIDGGKFPADAVVIAAGNDSARLLHPLGIRLPLHSVNGYSATVAIRDFDQAPQAALLDETYKAAITRIGSRLRIAGLAEIGAPGTEVHERAMRTLIKVGSDWFPRAANYAKANFWCGPRPMLPDGPPLLGTTPLRSVFINIGHGAAGWTAAAGAGKLVADIVSGETPDIDMDGLTLARYG